MYQFTSLFTKHFDLFLSACSVGSFTAVQNMMNMEKTTTPKKKKYKRSQQINQTQASHSNVKHVQCRAKEEKAYFASSFSFSAVWDQSVVWKKGIKILYAQTVNV